jgi:hypothetical protein
LRLVGVGGRCSVLLGADAYTAVSEASDYGYPVPQHLPTPSAHGCAALGRDSGSGSAAERLASRRWPLRSARP